MSTLIAPPSAFQQQLQAATDHLADALPVYASRAIDAGIAAVQAAGLARHSPAAGQRAPDFTLPDAAGQPVTLSTLLATGPVVLVFYRGNWCPYCDVQLRAYNQALTSFNDLIAKLIAVSPQTHDASRLTAAEKELRFPVLSDIGNVVAKEYGLAYQVGDAVYDTLQGVGIDLEAYHGDTSGELPLTATFVIARNRTIAWADVDANFKHRPDPVVVLDALAKL